VIVYNVQRRWFSMKNEANAYRRELKLPPDAVYTLKIEERESLAALLNGLCGVAAPDQAPPEQELPKVREMLTRNSVRDDIPDYVPLFLRKEWEAKWARDDKKGSE
jgi:hypothetical protein